MGSRLEGRLRRPLLRSCVGDNAGCQTAITGEKHAKSLDGGQIHRSIPPTGHIPLVVQKEPDDVIVGDLAQQELRTDRPTIVRRQIEPFVRQVRGRFDDKRGVSDMLQQIVRYHRRESP